MTRKIRKAAGALKRIESLHPWTSLMPRGRAHMLATARLLWHTRNHYIREDNRLAAEDCQKGV